MYRLALTISVCALLFVPLAAECAGVPKAVSYQGKLTDLAGSPVVDGVYQVQFRLYEQAAGGVAFWTSVPQNVTTVGGLFSTQLQPLGPTDLAGKTDVWLETWAGDPLAALTPRVKLASVPFALRAGDLDLPFVGSVSSGLAALSITNTGAGGAGSYEISNAGSNAPALSARTNGGNSALWAESTGSARAVNGYTTGTSYRDIS